MQPDSRHFLITLFNLRLWKADKHGAATQSADWLAARFTLFERYCLPSVAQQTEQDFTWLVCFDRDTPAPYRRRIGEWQQRVPQLRPLFFGDEAAELLSKDADRRARFLREAVAGLLSPQTRFVLTTNVDNDDAIHMRFVETLQRRFEQERPTEPHLYSALCGWQLFEQGDMLLRMRYPHNHFLTLAEPVSPGEPPRTIKFYKHTRARKELPTTDIGGQPLWMEVVHGANVSNELRLSSRIRYSCPMGTVKLDEFGLPTTLSAVHNTGNAFTRVPLRWGQALWRKLAKKACLCALLCACLLMISGTVGAALAAVPPHAFPSMGGTTVHCISTSPLGQRSVAPIAPEAIDSLLLRQADSLFMAASVAADEGDFGEAYRLGKAAAEESRRALGDNHYDCIVYFEAAGAYSYYVDRLDEAASFLEAAFGIAQATTDENDPAYTTLLSDLNAVYQAQGRVADALRVNEECLDIVERTIGSAHPNYAEFLGNAATLYDIVGNYREAARMGEKALAVCPEDYDSRVVLLNNQTLYYSCLGQCREALRTGREAVELSAKLKGTDHPDHAFSLYNLAIVEEKVGLYAEARAHYEQALDIRRRNDSPKTYAQTLMSLASFESNAGNYAQAVAQATEALDFLEQSIGKQTIEYAHTLNSLSLIHSRQGHYAEARRLNAQALSLCADIIGEQHPSYALTLNNLATICYNEGNYTEALSHALQARGILLEALGREHPNCALALGNIAAILFALEDYERSLSYQQEAADIALHANGEISPRYVGALVNIAQCYARLAQPDSALIIGEQVLALRERLYGQEHPNYVEALSSMAAFHHIAGHHAQAIAMQQDVLARTEQLLGTDHPDYCEALRRLCIYESAVGQVPSPEQVAQASEQSVHFISHTFADMGFHSRGLFWQKYSPWFERWVHQFAAQEPSAEQIANGYNAALTSKGLLLGTLTAFATLIQESGNEELKARYAYWNKLDREIERQFAITRSERTADIDSLRQVATEMEKMLLAQVKGAGNFLYLMTLRWTDVAEQLADDEAAVEFVAYPDREGDVQYVAYTLRKNGIPQRTALCTESRLRAIDKTDLYTTDSLTRLIWQPLSEALAGTKRIYFAPSGELHNLAIEWLPTADGSLLCEQVEMRRVSSTREVLLGQGLPPYAALSESKAAVFGGLTYGPDLPALPGSRAEALAVAEALEDAGCNVQLFTDTLGTAEALTALSGQHLQLLHLSTHGYYWPHAPRDRQRVDDLFEPCPDEASLRYSGLIGAHSDTLSALSLSSLDLRGVDLVVLSACRSGLGEVTGDGVFGLQRGFKKAGARTLMMTLWDVSDQVTALFMPRFYANLANGLSPYDALREAQDFLRTQTPYTEPVYWAPFILLDAITPTQND